MHIGINGTLWKRSNLNTTILMFVIKLSTVHKSSILPEYYINTTTFTKINKNVL
jgi:hypothetical protein